jgi:transposase
MADFFWFSDSQWARIEPHLPMDVRGKKRVDDRRVLSGIADVYGPKKTLYNRFVRWAERGIWEDIFSAGRHPGYTGPAIHRQQLHQVRNPSIEPPDLS